MLKKAKMVSLHTLIMVLSMLMLLYIAINPEVNYNTVVSWFYYGGAFAVPIMIISIASLAFWDFLLRTSAKFPYRMPPVETPFLDHYIENLKIGLAEEILFRLPVWLVATAHGPVLEVSLISSVIFAVGHYEYGPSKIPSAFTMGMFFCAITVAYGLPAAVISHAFLDLFFTLEELYLK